jgi:hypothetical protein
MLVHAAGLMLAQRLSDEPAALHGRANVVVLPPPCPIGVRRLDFDHAEALMERAKVDTRAFLDGSPRAVPLPVRRRRARGGPQPERRQAG